MRDRSAQRLLSALAAAGVPRLELSLNWHAAIWIGRPRDLKMTDNGVRAHPYEYRPTQTAKFQRRALRRQLYAKLPQSAI